MSESPEVTARRLDHERILDRLYAEGRFEEAEAHLARWAAESRQSRRLSRAEAMDASAPAEANRRVATTQTGAR